MKNKLGESLKWKIMDTLCYAQSSSVGESYKSLGFLLPIAESTSYPLSCRLNSQHKQFFSLFRQIRMALKISLIEKEYGK